MNAGSREIQWMKAAFPVEAQESQEENWVNSYTESGRQSDKKLFKDWDSVVPGSLAPCHLIVAAIQCMRNKGYHVEEAERYIDEGLQAAAIKDGAALQVISAKIYRALNEAVQDKSSPYWNYKLYSMWEEIIADCDFSKTWQIEISEEDLYSQVKAGWYGQLVGGALGTQIEGYYTENIYKVFGEVRGYLRKPETYNDDITYEIAFLDAFQEKGYQVTPDDIAYKWLELISEGYSAEEVALRNLRMGIFPPESGKVGNYYSDWIGVQMRTAIHGMVAPGNPRMAAELAAKDGSISHTNNGIIGGIFNAIMVSLAFVIEDMKELVIAAIECLPKNSEYYQVVSYTLKKCQENTEWQTAWKECEKHFQEYNWVHTYPNAAAEIVALWFGQNDFDQTAFIIAMAGLDVDCNAGPVLNILGIARGIENISERWLAPLGTEIKTTMRKFQHFQLEELIAWTVEAFQKAKEEETI
ncbi:ADP-ribosylglycohydrolase [Lachnospiraceae bacterium PM6-15]|uniref:ADP-ribosylglycohydrolase family protein n=1 Tax=Ohessyouella blattaphilus TaxID=2949333 RepID=UPI003E1E1EDB